MLAQWLNRMLAIQEELRYGQIIWNKGKNSHLLDFSGKFMALVKIVPMELKLSRGWKLCAEVGQLGVKPKP